MDEIIVVGIGNPYRGDDGAGWVVIDVLKTVFGNRIALTKQKGDIAVLLDLFEKYPIVYVVDACQSSEPAGTWRRIDALVQEIDREMPQASTHGFTLTQAIAMAKQLDQLPQKLILYAISGNHFTIKETLSPAVEAAVKEVAEAIENEKEICACMKRV